MHGDDLGSQRDDGIESGTRTGKERFGFAKRHEPGVEIAGAAGIDFFESLPGRVEFVEFNSEFGMKCGKAMRDAAACIARKNEAQTSDSAAAAGMQGAIEPEKSKR